MGLMRSNIALFRARGVGLRAYPGLSPFGSSTFAKLTSGRWPCGHVRTDDSTLCLCYPGLGPFGSSTFARLTRALRALC